MQKFLELLKKFWITAVAFIIVAFLAFLYTYGTPADVLIPSEDNIVNPK